MLRKCWRYTANGFVILTWFAVCAGAYQMFRADVMAMFIAAVENKDSPFNFRAPQENFERQQRRLEDEIENKKEFDDVEALHGAMMSDWKNTSLTAAQYANLQAFLYAFEINLDTYLYGKIPEENFDTLVYLEFVFNQWFLKLAPPVGSSGASPASPSS